MNTQSFMISGIHCDACLKLISRRVGRIEGVTDVSVEKTGQTAITANRQIQKDEIVNILNGTEYRVA